MRSFISCCLVKKTRYNVEDYSTKLVLYGMRLYIANINIEAKRRITTVTVLHIQKYNLIASIQNLGKTVALLGQHQRCRVDQRFSLGFSSDVRSYKCRCFLRKTFYENNENYTHPY